MTAGDSPARPGVRSGAGAARRAPAEAFVSGPGGRHRGAGLGGSIPCGPVSFSPGRSPGRQCAVKGEQACSPAPGALYDT
jgi:hypothetical protein